VAACRRYGLSIVVYNPIAGGLFSGKYKLEEVPEAGRFSDKLTSGGNYRRRYFKDAYFEALSIIEPVAKKLDLSLIEVALRWVTHHSALKVTPESGGNDGIIIGVSSISQLEENLKALEKGPLPQEMVDTLDKAWMVCKAEVPQYWQGQLEYGYNTRDALFGQK
jgi:aflatoxin B1 aldehyde reductase